MKKWMVLPLLVVFILIISVVLVSSTDFTPTASPATLRTGTNNQAVNFTITNTNTSGYNITQVNFTFPTGFDFVSGSNSTNTTDWVFQSSASSANWTNSSDVAIGIVNTSAWFYFRINTSLVFNNFSFTVTTTDTAGTVNSKNVSIIVEPEAVSINRKFGAQPAVLYLNWTNYQSTNITLIANSSASNINEIIIPEVDNSTAFTANYSQYNSQTACSASMKLFVLNASGYGTLAGTINGSSTATSNVSLFFNTFQCSPGRYRIGNLMIRNSTEILSISVILDIPISLNSTDNPLNTATGVGSFGYTGYSKMEANATTYHSYYFNSSSMNYTERTSITSVTINLTGWNSSQDIDLFLFDRSGNLKAKSINKTNAVEWLTYSYLPTPHIGTFAPEMWEIRLYGNTTNSSGISYYGYVIFSTLNATNSTDTSQQISLINFTSISGGALNVTNTSTINLTLKNQGSFNLTNVVENKELYYVQRFSNSGNQNISFFVPNSSIASKVMVSLNWTGASNYSFNVYKSDGSLILTSMNKFIYANVTNATQEEYNETTSIGSTNGYWKIDVRNNTNITDTYTVAVLAYVDSSKWIGSNFSTFSFNTVGQSNSTNTVNINLTVPNDTVDGKYEGYVQYKSSSGATLRTPLEAMVKSAMLFINNSVGTSTIQIDENIVENLTKTLNITINNTGSYNLTFVNTSTGRLNLTTNTTNYIPFTFISPSSPIVSNSSSTINISININKTTFTEDKTGIYEGSIVFTTNDSYPYNNFTLILRVNLTNLFVVKFGSLTSNINNPSIEENATTELVISYVNGTNLTNDVLSVQNFTSVWITSANISGYRIPGSITITNGTNPIWQTSTNMYSINLTLPSNSSGGVYAVNLFVNYTRADNRTFGGYGISSNQAKYLTVNKTGLYMSGNQSTVSLYSSNTTTLNVSITNYGIVTSNSSITTINFTESCADFSISGTTSNVAGTGCSITSYASADNRYNLTVPRNSTCWVWWTITAAATGSGSACSGYIRGSGLWYNPAEVNVSVTVTNTTTGGTTTSTGTTTTTTTTNQTANLVFNKAENLIQLLQNSTNSTDIEVKNTGDISLGVTFKIEGIDSSWYTLNDTSEILASGKTAWFKVTFTVGNVDVKDYAGKFNASSASKTITKDFTLRVMPTPAKQVEINDTLALYKADAINLEVDINESKSKGINVTLIEQMMNDIKLKIEQAETYINQGDYFSAYQLFTDINTLLNNTKTELANAKAIAEAGKIKLWWIIAGVAAAIIGIGVLAYMFWPTKPGYHQEKGFTPKKEESLWNNLKDKWKKIKGGE